MISNFPNFVAAVSSRPENNFRPAVTSEDIALLRAIEYLCIKDTHATYMKRRACGRKILGTEHVFSPENRGQAGLWFKDVLGRLVLCGLFTPTDEIYRPGIGRNKFITSHGYALDIRRARELLLAAKDSHEFGYHIGDQRVLTMMEKLLATGHPETYSKIDGIYVSIATLREEHDRNWLYDKMVEFSTDGPRQARITPFGLEILQKLRAQTDLLKLWKVDPIAV